jgi:hypothetical protein
VKDYLEAIEAAKTWWKIIAEGGLVEGAGYESGCYVKPCIIEAPNYFDIVQTEKLRQPSLQENMHYWRSHQNGKSATNSKRMFRSSLLSVRFRSRNVNEHGNVRAEIGGKLLGEKKLVVDESDSMLESLYEKTDKHYQLWNSLLLARN